MAIATVLVALGLCCAPAIADAAGTLSGTVTALGEPGPAADGAVGAYDGNTLAGAAPIKANGSYTIPGMPAGQYTVLFVPPAPVNGPGPPGTSLLRYYHGGADGKTAFPQDAAPITIANGATTTLNGSFPLEAVVTGHLKYPDGSPTSAVVSVFNSDGRRYGQVGQLQAGSWTVRGLLPGQVKVHFSSANGGIVSYFVEDEFWKDKFSLGSATPVTATAGVITGGIDAVVTRTGNISGMITKPDGSPLRDVRVFLKRSDGRRAGPFTSGQDGRYVAYGLRPGQWSVAFVPATSTYLTGYYSDSATLAGATPVTVTWGKTVQVDAALARAARISGLVTDESRGSIPGVKVTVYNGFDQVVGTATTGANGQYSIGRLGTGEYRVGFEPPAGSGFAPEFYDNVGNLAQANSIFLLAGSSAPAIDAELALD
jgi:Carboxypeptidase regulatory-like domain